MDKSLFAILLGDLVKDDRLIEAGGHYTIPELELMDSFGSEEYGIWDFDGGLASMLDNGSLKKRFDGLRDWRAYFQTVADEFLKLDSIPMDDALPEFMREDRFREMALQRFQSSTGRNESVKTRRSRLLNMLVDNVNLVDGKRIPKSSRGGERRNTYQAYIAGYEAPSGRAKMPWFLSDSHAPAQKINRMDQTFMYTLQALQMMPVWDVSRQADR